MNRMPLLSIAILCALGSCSLSGARGNGIQVSDASMSRAELNRSPLFQLTKSENANYVVYDVFVDKDGRLTSNPLDVYWIMDARDGHREELNSYEQNIYGVTIEELDLEVGLLGFRINAMESRRFDVEVRSRRGEIEAYTTIDGQRAKITHIHLFVRSTWNPFSPDIEIQLDGLTDGEGRSIPVMELIRG